MPSSNFSPDSLPNLAGRVYLVTGGNAGIGKSTVIALASKGATVYLGARSEAKATTTIQEIKVQLPSAHILFLPLDLSSFQSVVSAAKKLRSDETSLHGLVNNAGIMGTNYLSHWLLTFHLLPLLQSTAAKSPKDAVRVVNVTSDGHARFAPKDGIVFSDISLEKESPMTRYGQSKLANILHTKQLHYAFGPGASNPICVAAVHPGHIDTNLNKQATGAAPGSVLRTITPIMRCLGILDDEAKGAWSSLFAVASDEFGAKDSGAYVVPYAKIGTPSPAAQDEDLARRLWEWSREQFNGKGLLEIQQ
ncbi:hypothetical protein AK830_g8007 [Neonectria ditissima]|uniref:NAD(P)-binding protein n=1 Tax=Neonectria ditissima TaxID=78410 RepID=A0A0N8H6C5_9HYPO|nr:hypothetical protein AK830_g8007 [Neonectria ditissima]